MRFVVRNVRFDLFLLENPLICTVTAWGAPDLGQVVPFHCPVDIWLLCCGNAHQKQNICSQGVESSPGSH